MLFQGMAHWQDDVHPGSDPEVDVRIHGISAALTHRIQQVHHAKEPQGRQPTQINDVGT